MTPVNAHGRSFINGKSLSRDVCHAIVDSMIKCGAPQRIPNFKCLHSLAKLTREYYKVVTNSVVIYCRKFCNEHTLEPSKKGPQDGHTHKLTDVHLGYIEYFINEKPSRTIGEIMTKLKEYHQFPDGLHRSTVERAVHNYLSSGRYSRKRMKHSHQQRYTPENMVYTQAYIDELYSRAPHRL